MSQGPQLVVAEETSAPAPRASRWRRASSRGRENFSGRAKVSRRDIPENEYVGGWLCPTKVDLVRLVDMSPAVRRARILAGAFLAADVAPLGA